MRIDKLLSHTGYGTRTAVKQLLKKKSVQVDNKTITKGNVHVDPVSDEIIVNGEVVVYQEYVYLMLHKPAGVISATFDHHDKTVIDLVPSAYDHYNLFPVGRLDKDTEGLLLLTNDGPLNHALTSPKKDVIKTYYAKVNGCVTEKEVAIFKTGVKMDNGYIAKPAELRILQSGTVSEIELDITEGKFHQVKKMFESVDMSVMYLKRISMGDIILDDKLPAGKVRALNQKENTYLNTLKDKQG